MGKQNINQLEYNAVNDLMLFLKKKWYPDKSIVLHYKSQNIPFDITIVEEKTKTVAAIIEVKIIENIEDFKEGNDQKYYDQLKKYYDVLEEWTKVYLALYNSKLEKKIFVVVKYPLFKWDNFLEVKDFPTYREITWSKLIEIEKEEKKDVNNNYTWFKRISWMFWGISIVIFFLSLYKCELLDIRWNYIKNCSIDLTYPNIILFSIWIILILIPFLRKIKTQWFEIDWEQENKGNK